MRLQIAVLSIALSFAGIAIAQEHHHDFDPNEKLGTVKFPISCKAEVQNPFARGVALLHSFGYEEAEKQFKHIAEQDPKCAMAYWGQAMSIFHQLWDRPKQKDLKQGWELVEKGRKAGAKTPRERDYLSALAAFYRDYKKASFETRVAAYASAMEKLYATYPDDHEAGAFYGLALLAAAPPHDANFTNQKKAVDVLDNLFGLEPDHPGIPHYIIHSCDSPQLASLGLNAARKYASIAPSAPHAVHMPSHIFARLGLWQESIQSNLASVAAAEKTGAAGGHALHALDFLHYAYLQVGEDAKARQIHERIKDAMPGHDMGGYLDYARAQFPATYALEMKQWKDALALVPLSGVHGHIRATTFWAHGVAAGHLHDVAAAEQALKQYDEMIDETRKAKEEAHLADFMQPGRDEVRAWLSFAQNKQEEAFAQMRAVADKQDAEGKGEVELPAREMLADMLLEAKQPQQALAEYEKSLKVDPNRFNGLYGAARAAEAAGQPEAARKFYAQLVENCKSSVSERPELAQARQHMKAATAGN